MKSLCKGYMAAMLLTSKSTKRGDAIHYFSYRLSIQDKKGPRRKIIMPFISNILVLSFIISALNYTYFIFLSLTFCSH
jgi:uncharacterized protein involved in cysteine biosynthesis